jgi:hypothetical protein
MLTLDNTWDVEVLGVSERGFIDTVALRSAGRVYDRVRFDRGKRIFIDAAPDVSPQALQALAVLLQNRRAAVRHR